MRAPFLLIVAASGVAAATTQSPEAAYVVRTKTGTRLQVGSTQSEVGFSANSISWAANGSQLWIWEGPGGKLGTWRSGADSVAIVATHAIHPQWSPDGSTLLYGEPGKGLFLDKPGSEPQLLAEDAIPSSGAWSADGSRIAFSTQDGIYSVNADGANRRRLLKDQPAKAIAWRPSDDSLTFVTPGLKGVGAKTMVLLSGLPGAHRLINLDADAIEWSPSGALLLAHTQTGWCTYDPAGGRINKIENLVGAPRWFGSKKLRYATSLGVATGLGEFGPIEPFPLTVVPDLVAWAEVPTVEFTNDMIFRSPFAGAPLPSTGEIRVEGYIDSADPLKGECTVQIRRVIDATGKETNYTRNLAQPISISDDAVRADGKETHPFRSIDLRSDLNVSMVLNSEKPTPDETLSAREVRIAGTPLPAISLTMTSAPRLTSSEVAPDGVSHEIIVVPLVFPVLGVKSWSDSFLANRDGGSRRHLGQDLIAPKMTPIVACFDGIVYLGKPKKPGGHYTLTLKGDNGWIANYYHINNDTPGTDDGLGGDENAYAPGLESGQRVTAGQFIAYVGDSGNAEDTVSHLHFELWDSVTKAVVNAAPSLRAATATITTVTVPQSDIKLLPKEVRYDGIVKSVDTAHKTIEVDLLKETKSGKAKAITSKRTVTVKLTRSTDSFVLGNENIPVDCSDLRPGLYAVIVVSPGKTEPRLAAFAPRDDE